MTIQKLHFASVRNHAKTTRAIWGDVQSPDASAHNKVICMSDKVKDDVHWVDKGEAARELEVSLSTLDRMTRKGEVEVGREGRRVYVKLPGPRYHSDRELLIRARARVEKLERTVGELTEEADQLEQERDRGPCGDGDRHRRVPQAGRSVAAGAERPPRGQALGGPAGHRRRRAGRAAGAHHPGGVVADRVAVRASGRTLPLFLEWEKRAMNPSTMSARLARYLRCCYSSNRPLGTTATGPWRWWSSTTSWPRATSWA